MKIKIMVLVNTLELGGAEKQSVFLCNAIEKYYDVCLVVYHGDQVNNELLSLLNRNRTSLITLHGNIIKKLFDLYKILGAKKVTHLFNFLTKPNAIGGVLGKIAKVSHIYGSIRTTNLEWWKIIVERFVANSLSHKTIVNSYSATEVFRSKNFKNLITIPNCFPVIAPIEERDVNKTPIEIISVGRFVAAKDYVTALGTIKQLISKVSSETIKYTIVGYGILEQKIRSLIKDMDLEQIVKIIVQPNNIPKLLEKSDVYLSTSLYEGTSNSILEAMNASLPIVATKVGDNSKMVLNENGYLHNVGDYKALAESIAYLVKHPKQRIKMGKNSNLVLRKNYSEKSFIKKYRKLIDG